ncbi:hypothetical protein SCAR479_05736 [Seiridium cardinale]|uniref:Uncharacterized protein n=1 Tax=Seiridium cardinale TaxID=138064 RepID=A0ABR2XV51_9PEZI
MSPPPASPLGNWRDWHKVLDLDQDTPFGTESHEGTDADHSAVEELGELLEEAEVDRDYVQNGTAGITPSSASADLVFKLHIAASIPNKTALLALVEAPQVKREFMKFHLTNKHADMLAKDQVEEIERNFIDYRWSVKHDIDLRVPAEKQDWNTDEFALAFLMRCVGWAEADPHFPAAVFRDDRYLEFRFAFAALGFFIRRVSTGNFADLDAVKSTPLAELKRRWLSVHASPFEDASQQPSPDGSSSESTARREEGPVGTRLLSESVLRVLSIFSSNEDIGWFKDWFDICLEDYSY